MITQNHSPSNVNTIVPGTLDAGDQEERIRAALGIAWGPLPDVQTKWLRRYYEYLNERLSLPFRAEYAEDLVGFRQRISTVTVESLIPPDDNGRNEQHGLLCRVRRGGQPLVVPLADVELADHSSNSRLIDDYWYWFWNCGATADGGPRP